MAELAEVQSREVMKGLKDLDRDPNIVANNRFIEWLDANEVWVKSRSTWGRAQHPLVKNERSNPCHVFFEICLFLFLCLQ